MEQSDTTPTPITSVDSLAAALNAQAARLSGLEVHLDDATPSPALVPVAEVAGPLTSEPFLATPQLFSGGFDQCRGFLLQVALILRHQPRRYSTDGARIFFIVSLLQG